MKLARTALVTMMMAAPAIAQEAHDGPPAEGPCKEIVDACKQAGYQPGQAKSGKGPWVNCVGPTMRGEAVAGFTADAAKVSACKQKHPQFGQGKGGAEGHPKQGRGQGKK